MLPAMLDSEIVLFKSVLSCSSTYVEFGAGGSTVLAAATVRKSVTTIDSSKEWLEKVESECADASGLKPQTIHVDIGPIRQLGYPSGDQHKHLWENYHARVWDGQSFARADTFLIDGRFRVACFLQTMLRCELQSLVLMHDFAIRPEYHVVGRFAREVARSDNLSIFQKRSDFDYDEAISCLREHSLDPR